MLVGHSGSKTKSGCHLKTYVSFAKAKNMHVSWTRWFLVLLLFLLLLVLLLRKFSLSVRADSPAASTCLHITVAMRLRPSESPALPVFWTGLPT